jgi:hypothetical protein
MDAVNGVNSKTLAMASGLGRADGAMVGMRERTELLRHSLDSMGGSFGSFGSLARLALDPMTLGFAAGFAAVTLFTGHGSITETDEGVFQGSRFRGSHYQGHRWCSANRYTGLGEVDGTTQ